jgi:hypothetical protein
VSKRSHFELESLGPNVGAKKRGMGNALIGIGSFRSLNRAYPFFFDEGIVRKDARRWLCGRDFGRLHVGKAGEGASNRTTASRLANPLTAG